MPRPRDPNREKAKAIFDEHSGNIALAEIAKMLQVPEGTIRGWKAKDKWSNGTERRTERSNKTTERSKPINEPADIIQSVDVEIDNDDGLTDRQREFCHCWIRNRNGRIAAIAAGYAPRSAHVAASRLLRNDKIRAYIELFREEVKNMLLLGEAEIVEYHMRIAFADITDFVEFKNIQRPKLRNGLPVYVEDPNDCDADGNPKQKALAHYVNEVRFKDSALVDGQLITEVSEGREGVKIKLADRHKSLAFLERFFMANPMDRHKVEYDKKRYELEQLRLEGDRDNDEELIDDWLSSLTGDEDDPE